MEKLLSIPALVRNAKISPAAKRFLQEITDVIRGGVQIYSSRSTSILHPSHGSQERIYKEVLHPSGLDPQDIDYVEMRGTGT